MNVPLPYRMSRAKSVVAPGTSASAAKFLDVAALLLGRAPRATIAEHGDRLARGGRRALIEVHGPRRFLRLLARRDGLHHHATEVFAGEPLDHIALLDDRG